MSHEETGVPKASPQEIYALVGGDDNGGPEAFGQLVDRFYEGVEKDPILRPMYPPEDLAEARENLALFLIQYFGGPAIYAMKRGHPRLRMRHVPFTIDAAARDAWLAHMTAALESVPAFAPHADIMRQYFTEAARFLQNRA
jgi:hemoglobin